VPYRCVAQHASRDAPAANLCRGAAARPLHLRNHVNAQRLIRPLSGQQQAAVVGITTARRRFLPLSAGTRLRRRARRLPALEVSMHEVNASDAAREPGLVGGGTEGGPLERDVAGRHDARLCARRAGGRRRRRPKSSLPVNDFKISALALLSALCPETYSANTGCGDSFELIAPDQLRALGGAGPRPYRSRSEAVRARMRDSLPVRHASSPDKRFVRTTSRRFCW
jgi:hypothetical protein